MGYVAIQHLLRDDCRLGGGTAPANSAKILPRRSILGQPVRIGYRPGSMSSTAHDTIARAGVLDFRGQMSVALRHRWAVRDVVEGLRLWPLARSLGWLDIRLRYRGSMLGPVWLTLSTAVMVGRAGRAVFHAVPHRRAQLPAVPRAVADTVDFSRTAW